MPEQETPQAAASRNARRRFLAACGKFALATPPAITLMLAAGERNYATAASGGSGGSSGNHNGGQLNNSTLSSAGNQNGGQLEGNSSFDTPTQTGTPQGDGGMGR
jgi:hypothetical protein